MDGGHSASAPLPTLRTPLRVRGFTKTELAVRRPQGAIRYRYCALRGGCAPAAAGAGRGCSARAAGAGAAGFGGGSAGAAFELPPPKITRLGLRSKLFTARLISPSVRRPSV